MNKTEINQEELYQQAMKRIRKHASYLKESYVLKNDISLEKIKLYGLFFPEATQQDLEEIFFQNLLETNQIIDRFPLIVYKNNLLEEREVMTDILIPQVNVSKQKQMLFFMSILATPSLNSFIIKDKLLTTRFFTYKEGKRISIPDAIDYLKFFSDATNYQNLLNMLLNYLENCFIESTQQSAIPQYLPPKMQEYYQEWIMQKESLDQEASSKKSSKQLKRILQK